MLGRWSQKNSEALFDYAALHIMPCHRETSMTFYKGCRRELAMLYVYSRDIESKVLWILS